MAQDTSGRCRDRHHATCKGATRYGACACECHIGQLVDGRSGLQANTSADALAIMGRTGTWHGIGFSYCAREGAYHYARPARERLTVNGRYAGRERDSVRARATATGRYVTLTDTDGNTYRELVARASEAHVSTGDDARARVAVYVARHALTRSTLDAQARAYRERATR